MTLETPVQAIPKGSLVAGKYRIIEEIGRGGMGIVYKAEDTKLKRMVALKFLPQQWISDKEARERFIHEAKAASALDHNNVCAIHEIEETEDGRMYIAMAFYEGESLREKIKREPLKTEEAVAIAAQVAQGMAKAHQKGIVHRDLKPANILVTNDGVAKIVDFGLAKLPGQVKLTREGKTVGTVAYMSPEQARGDAVDQHTDIWSLGVVLYEMLSGKLPFKGDYEQSLIHSILKSQPEPITKFRKDLPAGLANIITKTLVKNTAARYQTMDELVGDLKAVAEGLKPLHVKASLFQGRVLGIKKIYAYSGLAMLVALLIFGLRFLPRALPAVDSIAVLPFQNLSGNPEEEYFVQGMQDALITELSKIKALRVNSRTSTMRYKESAKSIPEIARDLNVDVVVEGSALHVGDQVRITAQVIDGKTDRHLWADGYERKYEDVLSLQGEVALAIAREIRVTLSPEEKGRLASARPVNPKAFEAYLKALYYLRRSTFGSSDYQTVTDYYKKAVEIDPSFALGYAGLAYWYWSLGVISVMPPEEASLKAKEAAKKALELDNSLAEAHAVLGAILYTIEWDWSGAEKEYRKALDLSPSYVDTYHMYGFYLINQGRFEEGIALFKRSIELDPQDLARKVLLAWAYMMARRFDEAITEYQAFLEMEPNRWGVRAYLAAIFGMKGMAREAIAEGQKVMAAPGAMDDRDALMFVGQAYALAGERTEAIKLLSRLKELAKKSYVDGYYFAAVYSALDDTEQTFYWLQKAYENRSLSIVALKVELFPDKIRNDPRYLNLLKKMGLE
jgi:serine/threonine-protein kinase